MQYRNTLLFIHIIEEVIRLSQHLYFVQINKIPNCVTFMVGFTLKADKHILMILKLYYAK